MRFRNAMPVSYGLVALASLITTGLIAPAGAAETTAWVKGAHSAARLLDGGGSLGGGGRRVGLEIRLDPAFITYWRDPGDAGVPPTFDFAGSSNVQSAVVQYPAPQRLDEAGAAAFGYAGDVTFPILVLPNDPGLPAALRVQLTYAVCHDICLPARAALAIDLDEPPSAEEASQVEAAFSAVPRAAAVGQSVGDLAILGIAPAAGSGVSVTARCPPGSNLFVEAPEPFAFAAGVPTTGPDGPMVFPVKRVDGSDDAPTPALLTLTLVGPGDPPQAIEVHAQLDAPAKTP